MSSQTVIQVDNLWKKYRLGVMGTGTMRHDLNRWWHRVRGNPDPYAIVGHNVGPRDKGTTKPQSNGSNGPVVGSPVVGSPVVSAKAVNCPAALADDEMWALQGVSFEVKQGEILGIIGRNGAGKSTLLKILSRVTAPTGGEVRAKGRIASLLEVGTGFHPELTGRENIFLNGAILGMSKAEVTNKLEEIIAFAEVERFIDTPVKRYSSGMYVRLAFAVAAHLEPEILIVDEVLAVGDAQFQKKCLGKMGDVARGGRTVLFVSHNMAAVQRLCYSGILLDGGVVTASGQAEQVVLKYLATGSGSALVWERTQPPGEVCSVQKVWIGRLDGELQPVVTTQENCVVHIEFAVQQPCPGLHLAVGLMNEMDEQVFGTSPADSGAQTPENKGVFRATLQMPEDLLMAKQYGIRVALWHPQRGSFDQVDALRFIPQETASLGNIIQGGRPGFITVRCNWSVKEVSAH